MSHAVNGYVPVSGLRMYYEVHGEGTPLVLLHGGNQTIDLCFGEVLPKLAAGHQVIATEFQGHGRTNTIERDIDSRYLAGDVASLLDHLGIDQADFFGFSLGGSTALNLALEQPKRIRRMILASLGYSSDGFHPEIVDPARRATSTRMPTAEEIRQMREAQARLAPEPRDLDAAFTASNSRPSTVKGWTAEELGRIAAPALLVYGDHDFIRLEHAVEMHGLIPGAQLAVLPGTTHLGIMRRPDLIVPLVRAFLNHPDARRRQS